jgi:hypothetical protein
MATPLALCANDAASAAPQATLLQTAIPLTLYTALMAARWNYREERLSAPTALLITDPMSDFGIAAKLT